MLGNFFIYCKEQTEYILLNYIFYFDIENKYLKIILETLEKNRTLVFVQTKRDADLLALWLTQQNIKATTINGFLFFLRIYKSF